MKINRVEPIEVTIHKAIVEIAEKRGLDVVMVRRILEDYDKMVSPKLTQRAHFLIGLN